MRYAPIPVKLFESRRKSFTRKMIPGSLAIFYSNDPMPRNGDQCYPFRQDSSLFAVSGLDQPGTIIVLFPGAKHPEHREIAFILPKDREHAIWHGNRYSPKVTSHISGISTVHSLKQWDKVMSQLISSVHTIYTQSRQKDRTEIHRLLQPGYMDAATTKSNPVHNFLDSSDILREQLMIKHPVEKDMMKKAIEVTGYAFQRVLQTIQPGRKEYEVEAEITYVLTQHGCQHAFEPIVASGLSACTLHYTKNNLPIKKGDLVLLDFGAEYACMASDMTRTIPASGRYSKRQREIYVSVWSILKEMTQMMRPGVTLDQLNVETGKLVESELIKLRILTKKDLRNQDKESPLRKKYFMHGISHHLGYDVHDLHDRSVPLKTGMILTCEPGLYIPQEKTGIRLENDILITRDQPQNLMKNIPIDPDEIESMMHSF